MSKQAVTPELLVRELGQVSQWDILGTYLGLEESEIEEIERDHQDTARRRIVMITKWFEKDPHASWEKVIDALQCMLMVRLANRLKEKYIPCATPLVRRGPLDSSANGELTIDKEARIVREIESLGEEYFELVEKAEASLESVNPPPRKLKRFLQCYKQPEVQTVEELFDQQKPFYFLEYAFLEKMIKYFLKKGEVAENLCDYLKQLANFKSSTTVRDFMNSIEEAQQSRSTAARKEEVCTVTLRLVGEWLEKTMDDLEKLVNELFKEKTYVLSHLKIVRGSIIVTYLAPLSEADSLIMIAKTTTEHFMFEVGISGLEIGSWITNFRMPKMFSFGSSLLKAVSDDNIDLIRFLLSINTDPDAADQSNQTALHVASELNHDKSMSLLLRANANPNLQDNEGRTPLYIASREGHISIVIAFLLKSNANPDLQETDGCTPLYIASQEGHTDIVAILLKNNANPDLQETDGCTPLFIASQEGHTDVVAILQKHNANPYLQGTEGCTPLYIASQNGHTDIVALLLKNNTNSDLPRDNGCTPLFIASQKGHTDVVAILLKNNSKPDLPRDNGCTPLFIASENGHTDVVAILLKNNANPDLQGTEGCTPLYIASQNGHTDVVALLLKSNTNPDLPRDNGCTPLWIASQNGHTDVVAILLKNNTNPDLPGDNGCTPLFIASQNGHTDIVAILLKNNASPNLQHSSGLSALVFACHSGYLDIAEVLLMSGADPSMKSRGLTAQEAAARGGHEDIVDLLEAIKLSQSSSTSPALTANEIASKVFIDNRTMILLNKTKEEMLVKDVESFIASHTKIHEKQLPIKQRLIIRQ